MQESNTKQNVCCDTHPEFSGEGGRARLVVLVAEVGGR